MELLSISSTIQNLHKNSKKRKEEKHIEELNKSCEREEEKNHLIVNWMTSLHKKTIASHTQELKNDEEKKR